MSLGATLCHPKTPGDSVPSLDHPQLCADISLHVSLETRRLLWKPPSSSLLHILFLTLMWGEWLCPHPAPKFRDPFQGCSGEHLGWGCTRAWGWLSPCVLKACSCAHPHAVMCDISPLPWRPHRAHGSGSAASWGKHACCHGNGHNCSIFRLKEGKKEGERGGEMAPWGSRPGMCLPAQRVLLHTGVTLLGAYGGDKEEATFG